MAPSKKSVKTVVKLDTPFSGVRWPDISAKDQEVMLDMLCSILAPMGRHREAHAHKSKGKRRKFRKQSFTAEIPAIPPQPDIAQHVTLGLNSTSRHLALLTSSQPGVETQSDSDATASSTPQSPLGAIFLSAAPHHHLHSHFPVMASISKSQTRIVVLNSLPGAPQKLAETLHLPRVGIVGLMDSAPGADPLLDYIRGKVPVVNVPILKEAASAAWLGVKTISDAEEVKREAGGRTETATYQQTGMLGTVKSASVEGERKKRKIETTSVKHMVN